MIKRPWGYEDYEGCSNCEHQPAPLLMCDWGRRRTNIEPFCSGWKKREEGAEDVSDTNVGKMCEYYDLCRNGRDEKKLREELLSAQPECEDAKALKTAFLRMASYVDSLLVCSDEQKETLINLIAKVADYMPWSPHDTEEDLDGVAEEAEKEV